jgi:hypothetical protein
MTCQSFRTLGVKADEVVGTSGLGNVVIAGGSRMHTIAKSAVLGGILLGGRLWLGRRIIRPPR